MTITKNLNGNTLTIALEGRLDTKTSPELESVLRSSLDGVEELIFDLSDLVYVSSAGLRVLLFAHKSMHGKGKMKIINANEIVMEVFGLTGFINIFNIE